MLIVAKCAIRCDAATNLPVTESQRPAWIMYHSGCLWFKNVNNKKKNTFYDFLQREHIEKKNLFSFFFFLFPLILFEQTCNKSLSTILTYFLSFQQVKQAGGRASEQAGRQSSQQTSGTYIYDFGMWKMCTAIMCDAHRKSCTQLYRK